MDKFGGEIEEVQVNVARATFFQRLKKIYKKNAKIYNISFGLLGLALVVFSFKFKKK